MQCIGVHTVRELGTFLGTIFGPVFMTVLNRAPAVKRVRKPVKRVRKLKQPAVHIVPVSTAAPLPSSSEQPTVAPTSAAASRPQATGFRALRSRPKGLLTGLRGRLHHGNSDNRLR